MNQPQTQGQNIFLGWLRQLVVRACCIFTAITFALLCFQWILEQSLSKSINVSVFIMLLPLSFCIAGAYMIRCSDSIPTGGKVLLHPLLCLGGIYMTYLPYQIANHFLASTVLIHLLFFAIVYGLVTATVCIFSSITRRSKAKKDAPAYVSQFNLDKKNGKDR